MLNPRLLTVPVLAFGLLPTMVAAFNFRDPNTGIESQIDIGVAYGLRLRTEETNQKLVSPAVGGERKEYGRSGNLDDGTQNYDKGKLVSNMVRASAAVTLEWGGFGLFVRGYGFYDYENENNDREWTQLPNEALDQVGSGAEIQDAYLSYRFTAGNIPMQFRLGDQVLNWGESRFFPGSGVDVANPLNVPLFQQPTSTLRDLRKPVGMLWGAFHITPLLVIEAYYQYDWQETVLPGWGTYYSTTDGISPGGEFIQAEGFANQFGTDLTELLGISAETLEATGVQPFDPNFYQLTKRLPDEGARDSGQYGISLQTIVPKLNDTKIGLHYSRYHAKTPTFALITPAVSDYVVYSVQAIDQLTRDLRRNGAGLANSKVAAPFIQLSSVLNNVEYFIAYPEDIDMLGLSFNTTTMSTGTALFGEVAHTFDAPISLHSGDLLGEILPGATRANPLPPTDLTQITLEEIDADYANKRIDAFMELDKTFTSLGATQFFGPLVGASQTAINLEVAWLHIWDAPDRDTLYMAAPGLAVTDFSPDRLYATANSWGYRIGGTLIYKNVFGGVTLRPRVIWSHDVDGISPVGAGPFLEGRKALSLGLGVGYLKRLTMNFAYNAFWDGGYHGEQNLINDRDNFEFSIGYNF
jgi:hypothetical protein